MATEDQVGKCNTELKSLLSDLKGHRESAFIIRLTESLVKLTGSPDDAAAIEKANAPDPREVQRQAMLAKAAELTQAANALLQ